MRVLDVPRDHGEIVEKLIESELIRALTSRNQQTRNERIVLAVRDQRGDLVAGLSGATSYGWLLVKTLWVASPYRRMGFGRQLVEAAEARARGLLCHGAWLDTSDPGARAFYDKLGYREFAKLENDTGKEPVGHRRWFMRRIL